MKTAVEIKRYLRQGDMVKVAKMAGLSYDNAWVALKRPTSKHHKTVLKKAKIVARFNRENRL